MKKPLQNISYVIASSGGIVTIEKTFIDKPLDDGVFTIVLLFGCAVLAAWLSHIMGEQL